MHRSRLSRKHPHFVRKYFDVTPEGYPFTVRVVARTKRHARRLFKTQMKRQFSWTPQEWKEFVEHEVRLAGVSRHYSPWELKKMGGLNARS